MDPKFRVSIQPSWRPAGGESLLLLFSKEHGMPLVKVLSQAAYDKKVGLIQNDERMTEKKKGEMLGKLAMLSREATLNDQGKLLVPKDLSEKADIKADGDVALVGRGNYFQIWSKTNFDVMLEIETNQVEDDDLGIF